MYIMNLSGFEARLASSLIGSVEVFEPQIPSSDKYDSVFLVIVRFKSRFSNTASIIRCSLAVNRGCSSNSFNIFSLSD